MSHARSGARGRTQRRSARHVVAEADRYLEANEALAASLRRVSQHASALTRQGIEREEFVAALGHDLLQPLNALRVATQLLNLLAARQEPSRDTTLMRECAGRAQRMVDMMSNLVNGVMSAAELDMAPIRIDRSVVELSLVACTAADSLTPLAEEANLSLEVDKPPTGTGAYCDPTWIGDVLLNLIANAIRHSPRGGRVRVSFEHGGREVRCAVEDEGLGVPRDARDQLFQRFSRHGEHGGRAGLGLYISRRILELHGGRIWLDEQRPGGARFVFELPAAGPGLVPAGVQSAVTRVA